MTWSWKIGKLFGIPIRLHISMLLIPFLIFDLDMILNPLLLAVGSAAMILIFGFVLAHELGHALVARRYGIRTQDIILTPLGGMARVVDMPQSPKQEIAIAAAGPGVSLALAGVLALIRALTPEAAIGGQLVEVLGWLVAVNLMLGVFNMIPALPMDGGRILRGLLALKYDFITATRKAARVGKILAIAGIVIGILGYFLPPEQRPFRPLIVIAISAFVFLSAGMEQKVAEWRQATSRAAQGFAGAGGNSAPGGGPRVYTYTWTSRPRGRADGWSAPRQQPSQRPGWRGRSTDKKDEPIVIEGGKAEVLSRKDPTD
jgi:stage IV sporulation protein FB